MATARVLQAPRRIIARPETGTAAFLLVLFLWAVTLYEPHTFLVVHIGGEAVIKRLPTLMLIPLVGVILMYTRSRNIPWPLVLFWASMVLLLPFAYNRGLAMIGVKQMMRLTLLIVGTIAVVTTPARALVLLKMFALSFLWYGLQGIPDGKVQWHGEHANQDGLGPFLAIGVGFAYYLGLGARAKKWRYLGFGIAGVSAVGCIASFARGAIVGLAVALVMIWVRSPRKLATLAGGLVAFVMMVVAIEQIHTGDTFWEEMATISSGTSEGTGLDRKRLWKVGFDVWKEAPIFGVGAYSTGAFAARTVDVGEHDGVYADPGKLWGRALHNSYVQLLAETGLVGVSLWIAMLWVFVRQLRQLRAPQARAAWNAGTNGAFDLRCLSIGLEVSMITFLVVAFFYNRTFLYEFYVILALAAVLCVTTRRPPGRPVRAPSGGSPSMTPAP